jgi:hypothetical protein
MARNTKPRRTKKRVGKITQKGLAALERLIRKQYPQTGSGTRIEVKIPDRFKNDGLGSFRRSLETVKEANRQYESIFNKTEPVAQPERRQEERIDHPSHYGGDTIYEVIKVIDAWQLGFSLGNAIKYIARAGKKFHTSDVEDLKKARWYIDHEIERRERENKR